MALRKGTLTVHATSPVWANLLRNTEHSVVKTLQESGLSEVRCLRIRLAPPPATQRDAADERDELSPNIRRLFAQLRKALD